MQPLCFPSRSAEGALSWELYNKIRHLTNRFEEIHTHSLINIWLHILPDSVKLSASIHLKTCRGPYLKGQLLARIIGGGRA